MTSRMAIQMRIFDDQTSPTAESGENEGLNSEEEGEILSGSSSGSSAGETRTRSGVHTRACRQHARRGPAVTGLDRVEGVWRKEEPSSLQWSFQKTPGPTNPAIGQRLLQLFGRYFNDSLGAYS